MGEGFASQLGRMGNGSASKDVKDIVKRYRSAREKKEQPQRVFQGRRGRAERPAVRTQFDCEGVDMGVDAALSSTMSDRRIFFCRGPSPL